MTRILEIHAYNACESLDDCKRLWSKLPNNFVGGEWLKPEVTENDDEIKVENQCFNNVRTVSISAGRYTEVYFEYPDPESEASHYIELVLWFIKDMFPDSFIVFAVDVGEPWCTK